MFLCFDDWKHNCALQGNKEGLVAIFEAGSCYFIFGFFDISYSDIWHSDDIPDNKKAENLEKPIERILVNGVHWAIGYVGMLASKWIIGTTISHENIISDAFSNIESRTSIAVDGENITRIGAVIRLTDAAFLSGCMS